MARVPRLAARRLKRCPPLNSTATWMARDATTHDLLYVSNRQGGSVFVYSYPEGKLKGWLQNLRASGLCSDGNGDVFIPDGNEIREYGHGGTRPIAVLHDPLGGVTQFCAVDPLSGNLAVSGGTPRSNGVAIYANAAGSPKVYGDGTSVYWSSTYDSQGDLFVESASRGAEGAVNLLELRNGGTRLQRVTWNGTRPPSLGSIQWDGKYVAAESTQSGATAIFRYSVSRWASNARWPDRAQGCRASTAVLDSRPADRRPEWRLLRLRSRRRSALRFSRWRRDGQRGTTRQNRGHDLSLQQHANRLGQ